MINPESASDTNGETPSNDVDGNEEGNKKRKMKHSNTTDGITDIEELPCSINNKLKFVI